MDALISLLILAIVQGIAEWLPISSSAHLNLVGRMLGMEPSLMFEVALHFGTLMAVFVYFGKEIVDILREVLNFRFYTENGRLGLLLLVAAIPAGLVGFLMKDVLATVPESLGMLALGFLITSVLLFIGSLPASRHRTLRGLGWGKALFIGVAQILSLFRGVSRSGSTISAGLLLGLSEKEAVKFSFLLSIPIILGANILTIGSQTLPPELLWATLTAFGVGLCSIHFSFTYILNKREHLRWIALYVLVLALSVGSYALLV